MADSATPDALASKAEALGCRSVAFTYNDPVIFWEYAADVADACHEIGIKAIAVTAGYMCPEPRAAFYRHMDAANVDLKAFTEEFYRRTCAARLADVLDTLRYLRHETGVWLEITTLLIPGRNDSDDELDAETRWIATELGTDVPLHFSAFHPDYKMMDVPPTPAATLTRARCIAMRNGCNTSTPATSTTPRATRRRVRAAAPKLWSVTGTRCASTCWTTVAPISPVARSSRECSGGGTAARSGGRRRPGAGCAGGPARGLRLLRPGGGVGIREVARQGGASCRRARSGPPLPTDRHCRAVG